MHVLMANFGKESKPKPLIAKMSQETLAEMIGTTRSRVSFFLNRFRAQSSTPVSHANGVIATAGDSARNGRAPRTCVGERRSINENNLQFCGFDF
jgi:hypothetical protein